ncbi:hypothetical protein JXM67_10060 [candidate division WOR-3 bacterium]|nr:hypothetical protein [candidate division WOR-3 bacterium]
MKVKPIKIYTEPFYPTREFAVLNPELLRYNVPAIWKAKPLVAGTLAAFLLGGGIRKVTAQETEQGQVVESDEGIAENEQSQTRDKSIVQVAPLFIHGDGQGSAGCIVVAPPVFLSEEEASVVIEEEFKKQGVIFDTDEVTLDEVTFEPDTAMARYNWLKPDTVEKNLNLDGFNRTLGLGYEFVSHYDYDELVTGLYKQEGWSSVSYFSPVSLAGNITEKLENCGKYNVAIFYDPMCRIKGSSMNKGQTPEEYQEEQQALYLEARERSIELLKRQISDFIYWLKKTGVLDQAGGE